MKYLLDTCTISHFIKGHPNISQHLKATTPELIALSSISVMEIEYGLKLNGARAERINTLVEMFLSQITILPFENRDAKVAGNIRAQLKKAGTPIGFYDVLIASQTISHGLILVTQNTKKFARIPGLILEDWLH